MKTNQWIEYLNHWCPAQMYYYFVDAGGDRWCIYLRWRHQDPWTADLVRCDVNWKFVWSSPDNVNLLEEKEHTPGTIMGYYTDDEYPALMEKALELVKKLNPKFKEI